MALNNLIVQNGDLTLKFSCDCLYNRIERIVSNLNLNKGDVDRSAMQTRYVPTSKNTHIHIDEKEIQSDSLQNAFFYENTDYPLLAQAINGSKISNIQLVIAGHETKQSELKNTISTDDGLLFGTLNFHNQVGQTDFNVLYDVDDQHHNLSFKTEVLSFKMDYRSDMVSIIRDVEREYSMLSYSFLKQTYLSFRTKQGASTDLIWWQIFQSCYDDIVRSTKVIIDSPKRRLSTEVRYKKAERLRVLSPELENEYAEFEQDPRHLYRTEELILSKDTVENRFLKYVVNQVHRKFGAVKRHIQVSLQVEDSKIGIRLEEMENQLQLLQNHRFFRGIGQFKGFAQESMVMKKMRGYKDILQDWILLSCGYDLEEGVRKLEVKDISELYEIWCFIKIKNIVGDILGGFATEDATGKPLTLGFIRQLVYGSQSEVKFRKDDVELVSVMYNAQTVQEDAQIESAIKDTRTFTTTQRPDIVLRLSKKGDDIQYTYLFDAKYRIDDSRIEGLEVPPVDAINQMHRYRDAIYYDKSSDEQLKREIIGGYVLFPSNMNKDDLRHYHYQESINKVGIGAFPLKPSPMQVQADGSVIIDPNSSEVVLRKQIEDWLNDKRGCETLLKHSIPQKGLYYTDLVPKDALVFFAAPDPSVNDVSKLLKEGKATSFITGKKGPNDNVDLTAIQYFVPLVDHEGRGIYKVDSISLKHYDDKEPPYRIELHISGFTAFEDGPINFGVDRVSIRGFVKRGGEEYNQFIKDGQKRLADLIETYK